MKSSDTSLSSLFRVRRRYMRSVNLERDITDPKALEGYVPSRLAVDAATRFLSAWLTPGAHKAWTLTGVYGTGKSAFAHFLCSLVSPAKGPLRPEALRLLTSSRSGAPVAKRIQTHLPPAGLIRATVTARRESLGTTVLKALERGVTLASAERPRWRSSVAKDVHRHLKQALGGRPVSSDRIIGLARELAASTDGVLLVIDELGKCLEYAARDLRGEDDVYLLQQLAEASADASTQFAIVGLLHQGFGEYGAGLAHETRTEWLKVQGRFEDVVFAEPPEQILQLMARAIERRSSVDRTIRRTAIAWHARLSDATIDRYVSEVLTPETISGVLPLHPVAALALPSLCAKYAQNDRSLFTFLAGQEPHAFGRFLREATGNESLLPVQRVDDLYDYFAGIAGQAVGFRPQFQRWAEIHAVVSDARNLDRDSVAAIKTVAALNLVASSGPLRASNGLTVAALCQEAGDVSERQHWQKVLGALVDRGLLTYRRQLDEYRLWEGSDFDVEAAIRARTSRAPVSLADVLTKAVRLPPLVVQRHSYRSGTLRYFERRFVEDSAAIGAASCADRSSDGLLVYWVGRQSVPTIPATTTDGRPLVLVEASGIAVLSEAAVEFAALEDIERTEPQLQADGVARKEVRHRIRLARAALDRVVRDAIFRSPLRCHVQGAVDVLSPTQLQGRLSDACDVAYAESAVLWNELINRRELTSQGAKARRELIEAMLLHGEEERLGLSGGGPETSMYAAVLEQSGIHRQEGDHWVFGAPPANSGLARVWEAIATFCHGATAEPRRIDELFAMLEAPPYGLKQGPLPVLLAAVLAADAETISIYRDGSFLPTIGSEHFEVLVKHPDRFAIKHFALDGLRGEVFRSLQDLFRSPGAPSAAHRNATILAVVRPLVRFATNLPTATQRTRQLSASALAVRDALLRAREPDSLLFAELPAACGLPPIGPGQGEDSDRAVPFRAALVAALRELQTFHERRRQECGRILNVAFNTSADSGTLRRHLRRRVASLLNQPLEDGLRAFSNAAANDSLNDDDWLEAVVTVISERPLRTWTDEDAASFEVIAADLARRFKNLESIQSAIGQASDGDEVRRISLTLQDGQDRHRVVWISSGDRAKLADTANALAATLMTLSPTQREAVLALLADTVLNSDEAATAVALDTDRNAAYTHHG